jgi:hypothetical protein
MKLLGYIRDRPFSIMALANIVGDVSFLGFAFQAVGAVSVPKLTGALFTICAHVLLLAFGPQGPVAQECGALPRFVLAAQRLARRLTAHLPCRVRAAVSTKPVGIAFGMLGLNGVGLIVDACFLPSTGGTLMRATQLLFGSLVTLGTACFSFADFHRSQARADGLLSAGARLFTACSVGNVILAITSRNPFVALSILAYGISNITTFYAKLEKNPSRTRSAPWREVPSGPGADRGNVR